MQKQKLDFDGQIEHMRNKGIRFNIISEDEAKIFISEHTYYFKIKAYAKNYSKLPEGHQRAGQYKNLEFAYLKELSKLDMLFRYEILTLCLDIEHFLKVAMLKDFIGVEEDGYYIVKLFYDAFEIRDICAEIQKKDGFTACRDLVKKYGYSDEWAIWNIVEVLSFNDFSMLYETFYNRYTERKNYKEYLKSIGYLRNAAAHNNCLLNSLQTPYNRDDRKGKPFTPTLNVSRFISGITDIGEKMRQSRLSNPVLHDFAALLCVYENLIDDDRKKRTFGRLKILFGERFFKNKDFFKYNDAIISSFEFLKKIVDHLYKKTYNTPDEQKS